MKNKEIIISSITTDEDMFPEPASHKMFSKYFHIEDNITKENLSKIPYTGIIKINYSNGQKYCLWNYKNGKREGEQLIYSTENNLQSKLNMYNNVAQGIQYSYYSNGKVLVSNTYVDGKINGETINYYENGIKESIGHSIGDNPIVEKRVGKWICYFENGNIKEEGEWQIGGRHGDSNIKKGIWMYYDEDGKLLKAIEYDALGSPKNP